MSRRAAGVAVAVVLVSAACSSGGGSRQPEPIPTGGNGASETPATAAKRYEFCQVLDAGIATLSSNAASAGSGGLDQFSLFLTQLSETSRLIKRLESVAPKEIAIDMHEAVKAWDAQMGAVGNAKGDPLGALGAIFVSSLMSAASLQAVDRWSLANCGRAVFALSDTRAGTGDRCGWFPEGATRRSYMSVLRGEGQVEELVGLLSLFEANVLDPDNTAGVMLRAIQQMEPDPRSSLEALSRLRWADIEPVDSLKTVVERINAQCETDYRWKDVKGNLEFKMGRVVRPARLGLPDPHAVRNGYVSDDHWFPGCGFVVAVIRPMTAVARCNTRDRLNEGFVAVNLITGSVTRIDMTGAMPFEDYALKSAGDRIVWLSSVDLPQAGLEEPMTKRTLHSWVPGSAPISVEVSSFPTSSGEDKVFGRLALASGDRIISEPEYTEEWRFWTTEATLISRNSDADYSPIVGGTTSFAVLFGFRNALIDLRTGELTELPDVGRAFMDKSRLEGIERQNGPFGCGDRLIHFGDKGVVTIWETTDGVAATRRFARPELSEYKAIVLLREDRYAQFDVRPDADLTIYDSSGSVVRKYSRDVLKDVGVALGWIVATNKQDRKIIIDPDTGAEASGVAPALKAFLESEPNIGYQEVDPSSGKISLLTEDGLYEFDFADVCPR